MDHNAGFISLCTVWGFIAYSVSYRNCVTCVGACMTKSRLRLAVPKLEEHLVRVREKLNTLIQEQFASTNEMRRLEDRTAKLVNEH